MQVFAETHVCWRRQSKHVQGQHVSKGTHATLRPTSSARQMLLRRGAPSSTIDSIHDKCSDFNAGLSPRSTASHNHKQGCYRPSGTCPYLNIDMQHQQHPPFPFPSPAPAFASCAPPRATVSPLGSSASSPASPASACYRSRIT